VNDDEVQYSVFVTLPAALKALVVAQLIGSYSQFIFRHPKFSDMFLNENIDKDKEFRIFNLHIYENILRVISKWSCYIQRLSLSEIPSSPSYLCCTINCYMCRHIVHMSIKYIFRKLM